MADLTHAPARGGRLPATARRPVTALVVAQAVSGLGSQMTFVALPWFVLQTTGSASRMGLVLAAELLPVAILGIPSGTVIARVGARRTMLVADLARAPLIAAIPTLHALGMLSLGLMLALVALVGVFIAPYFSAQRILLAELVGEDPSTVTRANALVEMTQRTTSLLGPALAGVLIAALGSTSVLYVDAVTFLVAFATLAAFVPRRPPAAPTEESRGVLAGLRYLVGNRLLGALALTAMLLNMFGLMLVAGLSVLAYEEFGESSRVAGAFFTALGAGSVAGGFAVMALLRRFEPVRIAAVGLVGLSLPLWTLAFVVPLPVVIAALFLSGLLGGIVNAPLIGVITTRTPEALRPKVMTAVITTALLAGPLGLLLAGPLLEVWGPHVVFALVAGGELLAALPFALVAFSSGVASSAAEPSA